MSLYDNKNGVFTIGTGADGAPLLQAVLSSNTTTNLVTGTAHFSQPVNPPISFNSSLNGVEHATGLGSVSQVFALNGAALPPLDGAKHIISLVISLTEVWGAEGTATYSYYTDTPENVTVSKVPVTVKWLLLDQ